MGLIRDGKKETIFVTIGEQPADMGMASSSTMPQTTPLSEFGLTLQNLTPELAEQFGYSPDQGVLIASVEPDSPAGRVGLKSGQLIEEVNRNLVSSISELKEVMKDAKKDQVLLRIRSGNSSQYIVLRTE
jgi:serine protease Do